MIKNRRIENSMLKNKLLLLGTLSVLFSPNIMAEKCAGGVCFVTLDKHEPSQAFKKENQLLSIETPRFIEDEIDRSATIVLDGQTITVFPKSSYVMNEETEYNYYETPLLTLEELGETSLDVVEKLPDSEFFCDKDEKPVIHPESGFYECV